jgi:Ca2+-binding EF-hand superfamily protein
MLLDRELESLRQELSLRDDFNIGNLFKYFDKSDKGFFTRDCLRRSLQRFKIHPSTENLVSLFARLDKVRNGRV